MTLQPFTLTGRQRAAIVLAQLDGQRAAQVLRSMSEQEVIDLMSEMATLPPLDVHAVRAVLADFAMQATALMQVGQGGVEVARKLLRDRLGPMRAEEVLEQYSQSTHPLAFLHRIDPHQVATFLTEEHPQTIAVVLANLSPEHAAAVLSLVEDEQRTDVARRIATLGRVSPEVVRQIGEVLERRLAVGRRSEGPAMLTDVGGVQAVVAILNRADRSSEKQILSDLEQSDPGLAEEIRNGMFVFDDVVNLDDRTMQRVLRNIVPRDLAVALKGVSEEILAKFRSNMSERSAEELVEEMELLGPTRLSAVEAGQASLVQVVRELEASGEIVLSREDDELVV